MMGRATLRSPAVSVEFLVHEGFSVRGEGAWHLLDGDVRSALGLLVRITL